MITLRATRVTRYTAAAAAAVAKRQSCVDNDVIHAVIGRGLIAASCLKLTSTAVWFRRFQSTQQ